MRGDGVGQVAGRGARHRLEAELLRLGNGYRDYAVLEGVGRVCGVVLDPELAQSEPLRQPVGADQRRQPRLERIPGAPLEGQEIGVAPDSSRTRLDLPAGLLSVEVREVVGDLERTEALLAHVASVERVLGPAFLALEGFDCHGLLYEKTSAG